MKFKHDISYSLSSIIALLFFCFATATNAQSWTFRHSPGYLFSQKDSVPVTAAAIQGTWICFSSYYDGPSTGGREDVGPYYLEVPETAIFSGDSLFEYNYPCELKYRLGYALRNDSIIIGETTYTIHLRHDTLIICLSRYDYGLMESSDYEVRQYKRGSVDSTTIALLNTNGLNRGCLTGTWELVTKFDTRYDGNGIVDIDFPFRLPRTLKITSKNVNSMMAGNAVMKISADGKLRPFDISISEDNTTITFTTQSWYDGEWPFSFTYNLRQ